MFILIHETQDRMPLRGNYFIRPALRDREVRHLNHRHTSMHMTRVRISRPSSFLCVCLCASVCFYDQLRTVFSKGRKVLVRHEKGFFYQEGEIVKMAVRHTQTAKAGFMACVTRQTRWGHVYTGRLRVAASLAV